MTFNIPILLECVDDDIAGPVAVDDSVDVLFYRQ